MYIPDDDTFYSINLSLPGFSSSDKGIFQRRKQEKRFFKKASEQWWDKIKKDGTRPITFDFIPPVNDTNTVFQFHKGSVPHKLKSMPFVTETDDFIRKPPIEIKKEKRRFDIYNILPLQRFSPGNILSYGTGAGLQKEGPMYFQKPIEDLSFSKHVSWSDINPVFATKTNVVGEKKSMETQKINLRKSNFY